MRQLRFFVPIEFLVGHTYEIPPDKARHMLQVLRLSVGAELILFNGDGNEYLANLTEVSKKSASVFIQKSSSVSRESSLHIHLVQGISKGDRMDATIQKCVELGVSKICPVKTARSNVKIEGSRLDKKVLHWRGIVQSACEQSGRNVIPELASINQLEMVLAQYAKADYLKLVLNPESSISISELPNDFKVVVLLVGPEGGFSEQELTMAEKAGFLSLSLGPRVLRTETAAMAFLSILQSRWGDI